jgi:hypothetical protein
VAPWHPRHQCIIKVLSTSSHPDTINFGITPDYQFTMGSHNPRDIRPSSRFLELPREIRDLIYEHVLVRDVIPIECAITTVPANMIHGQKSRTVSDELINTYPLKTPRIRRRIWSVPTFDFFLSSHLNRGLPENISMTYQIANISGVTTDSGTWLQLLQACKQIYEEASKVFYGSNVFSFTADFRIPTAFSFLCDRPAASLLLIRVLELGLMEANNLRGTTDAHYPFQRRSTDSLVLQFAYHHFTELCTLLSTSRMRLRKLYLTVESNIDRSHGPPLELAVCLSLEEAKLHGQQKRTAPWLEPLLKIEGLDTVELYWISDVPYLRRMANTVKLMRRDMLGQTRDDEDGTTTGQKDDSSTFNFHVLCHYDEQTSHEVSKSMKHLTKWRACVLDDRGVHFDVDSPEQREDGLSAAPAHLKEILEGYELAYVCHCDLSNC